MDWRVILVIAIGWYILEYVKYGIFCMLRRTLSHSVSVFSSIITLGVLTVVVFLSIANVYNLKFGSSGYNSLILIEALIGAVLGTIFVKVAFPRQWQKELELAGKPSNN